MVFFVQKLKNINHEMKEREDVAMQNLLLKGGWVIDPSQKINRLSDILISDGKIKKIQDKIEEENCKTIDVVGKYIVPGLIDMHVHFREPGYEQKETIETGSLAAVAGGFTSVVCMPNTNPVIDNVETLRLIQEKAKRASCHIYVMGSITKMLSGEELSPYSELKKEGIVAITDDGKSVANARVLYEAMQQAKELDLPVGVHCEDLDLVYDHSIHRGEVSQKLHLSGIPAAAEEIRILRDIFLAEKTGVQIHIQHVSTKRGVEMIREAKKKGLKISCEVTPHHFTLTDAAVLKWGTYAKMSPPLRTSADVQAIKQGLADRTIDAIATDHAPHTIEDKKTSLPEAANGIVGLETALGLALTELYHTGDMSLEAVIEKFTFTPARILNIPKGTLKPGSDADIAVIDLEKQWTVDAEAFYSKGRNTPFDGRQLKGKAVMTIVSGEIRYSER
jgi:dihydroorotase